MEEHAWEDRHVHALAMSKPFCIVTTSTIKSTDSIGYSGEVCKSWGWG